MDVQIENLKVEHIKDENQFSIDFPQEGKAVLEYRLVSGEAPYIIEFTHTFVTKSLRNQGIATKLVEHGLTYAKEKGYKIRPICPFVVDYVENHPEFKKISV